MSSDGSITRWIGQLQAGDPAAAQPLWERYFRHLVDLARRKLLGARPQGADEEDVALSAFDSFCRGLKRGRFPELQDRDNLWKLLVVLTARKACHLLRDEQRLKRGGGQKAGTAADLQQVVAQAIINEAVAYINLNRLDEALVSLQEAHAIFTHRRRRSEKRSCSWWREPARRARSSASWSGSAAPGKRISAMRPAAAAR